MPRRGTSLGAEPAEARAQPAAECMLARVEAQVEAAAERAPVQVEARLGPPVEGR